MWSVYNFTFKVSPVSQFLMLSHMYLLALSPHFSIPTVRNFYKQGWLQINLNAYLQKGYTHFFVSKIACETAKWNQYKSHINCDSAKLNMLVLLKNEEQPSILKKGSKPNTTLTTTSESKLLDHLLRSWYASGVILVVWSCGYLYYQRTTAQNLWKWC